FSSDGGAHINTTTGSPGCQSPTWQRSNVGLHALWLWSMSATPGASNLGLIFGVQDDGFHATTTARNTPPSWINPTCCDVFDTVSDANRVLITVCCFSGARAAQLQIGNADGTGLAQVNTYPSGSINGFRSTARLVEFG